MLEKLHINERMQKRKREEREIIWVYGSKCIDYVYEHYEGDNLYIVNPNTKWCDGVFEESTIWFQGIPHRYDHGEDAAYELYVMLTCNKNTKGFLVEPKGETQWIEAPRVIISSLDPRPPKFATIVINSDD